MKTHILHLESFDDIISACDRLTWAKSKRILVVWPETGSTLRRPLDLVLLKRKAEALGAQIAFVAHHPDILFHAPRLGIPVFKSIQQAQRDAWRVPRRFRSASYSLSLDYRIKRVALPEKPPQPSPLHPLLRLSIFTISVLAVLMMASVLLPSAKLQLTPQRITQEVTIQVRAFPEQSETHITGIVPLRPITITVEGRASMDTSGSMILPYQHATGTATFTNLTEKPVLVPKGTVVRTIGQPASRFVVTQQGEVPAGPGRSVDLAIRCLSAGSQGNIRSGEIQAIEGALNTQLVVTNREDLLGGSERIEPAPTLDDRRKLLEQLTQELETNAKRELENSLNQNDILIPGSYTVLEPLEADFYPAEEQPAARIFLTLRIEMQAMVVSKQDLQDLAKQVLDSQIPSGYTARDHPITIQVQDPPTYTPEGEAQLQINASRQLQAEILEVQVVRLILFQPVSQAAKNISTHLLLAKEPDIYIFPTWWPWLPLLPFRIQVLIS